MTPEEFRALRNLTIAVAFVAVVWMLMVLLCRSWVRREIIERGFTPLSVRWRFFATSKMICRFKARYTDSEGRIHEARCKTSWYRPDVTWESDEIV